MSDLYSRILLWHKLLAQQTGGLALCSSKRTLNREEARGWIDGMRAVADDVEAFLTTGAFVLDNKGQRAVRSFGTDDRLGEPRHVEQPHTANPKTQAAGRKTGGHRIATRKRQ